MSKLSVIIPSRNERFLPETVKDLLSGSGICSDPVLDGYTNPILPDDPRLVIFIVPLPAGYAAINAAAVAAGKY
jgi:hypothetical protein